MKVGRDYIRTYIPAASADEEDKDAFFVESKVGGAAATVKAKYITSLNVYRDVRDNVKFSWSLQDSNLAATAVSGADSDTCNIILERGDAPSFII